MPKSHHKTTSLHCVQRENNIRRKPCDIGSEDQEEMVKSVFHQLVNLFKAQLVHP